MTATRRRKFWGWGYEDQQPPHEEVEQAAAGAREHLGFGPAPVERAAAPRGPGPAGAAARAARRARGDLPQRPLRARARTPTASSYRDVVRAFRGRFDHPPDVVAHPRDEAELERVLDWCAEAGAAAIPFGGGTSVVGGVEPRCSRAPTPARSRST